MKEDKKIQQMKLDAELLAAGVKVADLKNEHDTANSEKLVAICLVLSILGFVGNFLGRIIVIGGNDIQNLMGIWFSVFPLMSTAAIILAFWGIIVLYGYHKKSGLMIRRQILELIIAIAVGFLNLFSIF